MFAAFCADTVKDFLFPSRMVDRLAVFPFNPGHFTGCVHSFAKQVDQLAVNPVNFTPDFFKACLLYTSLPFDEIARTVGYNERGYLDRLFKQRFGKTMSEYRKEHAKSPRAAP